MSSSLVPNPEKSLRGKGACQHHPERQIKYFVSMTIPASEVVWWNIGGKQAYRGINTGHRILNFFFLIIQENSHGKFFYIASALLTLFCTASRWLNMDLNQGWANFLD